MPWRDLAETGPSRAKGAGEVNLSSNSELWSILEIVRTVFAAAGGEEKAPRKIRNRGSAAPMTIFRYARSGVATTSFSLAAFMILPRNRNYFPVFIKNLILFFESLGNYRRPQIIKFAEVIIPNLFTRWILQQKFYMIPVKTLKENQCGRFFLQVVMGKYPRHILCHITPHGGILLSTTTNFSKHTDTYSPTHKPFFSRVRTAHLQRKPMFAAPLFPQISNIIPHDNI